MPPINAGILNVYKLPGMTSRDVVDQVEILTHPEKAGHAGTLDPLAEGVLLVCIGKATRLIEYLQELPKCYRAIFDFGKRSPTDDVDGDVTIETDAPQPERTRLEAALREFVGTIDQRPPSYSAVKVRGVRAYKRARRGEQVSLEPRKVTIHELRLLEYEYPRLHLEMRCSSGTYVRSLGRDLAERLGTCAIMTALVRTQIGDFSSGDSCPMSELTADRWESWILPASRAVARLPRIELNDDEVTRLQHGQTVVRDNLAADVFAAQSIAAFDARNRLAAIVECQAEGIITPRRVFLEPLE